MLNYIEFFQKKSCTNKEYHILGLNLFLKNLLMNYIRPHMKDYDHLKRLGTHTPSHPP